jgi:hypothetical protein
MPKNHFGQVFDFLKILKILSIWASHVLFGMPICSKISKIFNFKNLKFSGKGTHSWHGEAGN